MSKVKVFADSTSDLPAAWISQYHIGIIPLYVVFDEESYKDGTEITPADLYQQVEKSDKLPKTTAPSPKDFMDAFGPHIERGEDILYISLSSELSSTYQNARIAAAEFPEDRIRIVDSLNLCSGIGLLVMKAVRAAESGSSLNEIVSLVETYRPLVETEFVIDTLEYLYKGGRCSGMQNFIGSLLQIRPVLKVVDGGIIPAYRVRGRKEKAVQQMLDNTLANRDLMDNDLIIVAHSFAEEEALRLAAILREQTGAREVAVTEAGCVISSHCGKHTIGIMYTKKPSVSRIL
ncbi:DegV family protein with EDD domain [Paenibacillus anaericanus]|uniref:DegV family protein n=1 Tax=Paenibacillus anaericanus TaxID=170367 RepID=UPI00277EBEE0|nr:DegV family protein [Paenibacillus anaericanus]MDQ0087107.1 DegV family protein with EDD domain [Paenibacillus anaericanus]